MAQRRDHGAGHQADPIGSGGDRGEQQEGARPGRPRILVVRQRIVSGVLRQAGGA